MSTAKNNRPALDNTELRRLKGIGHELKPVVTIGNKGLTESVIEELDRALNDHELIKIKTPPGSKEEREVFSSDLAEKTGAQLIHSIGRMALLLRRNPNANPKLSNLSRYSD
ncbi:YhbY family RNA-binding protein [Psychrobacter phenylpyruvicus]|uniref:RNA-binding protein HI_1333 n=1 Tax=Psychrobacter phenylpyruvicus TaxID=29432 RepID=A0A379LM26_9GAMM|nr:YhbY family RNA-binding protein [Psychrobacter phenylpyruvicus]SUD91491.1 RNA-binding protein HI_1333 [Psychrobacter phenylpyruvicus]